MCPRHLAAGQETRRTGDYTGGRGRCVHSLANGASAGGGEEALSFTGEIELGNEG